MTLIGLALYFVICGGLGCYVATEKGREWYEGLLFGLLLGPLGVIAGACMPTLAIKGSVDPVRPRREKEPAPALDVNQLAEQLRQAPAPVAPRQIFPHVS
jgi:hypothetical protein